MMPGDNSKEIEKSQLKILWFFVKPYKWLMIALFTLSLAVGALESASVAAIYPIVSLGLNLGPVSDNRVLSLIGKIAALLPVTDTFISFCVLFLLLVVLAFAVKVINTYFATRVSSQVVTANKERIFEKQMRGDYQYFLDQKQGELMYVNIVASNGITQLITSFSRLLSQIILIVFIFILLFSITWRGTLVVIFAGTLYYLVTQYISRKVSYATAVGRAEASTREQVILNEVFNGIKQIKVFLTQRDWLKSFKSAVRQYYYYYWKGAVWNEIPAHVIMLFAFLAIGVMALILKIQNPEGFTPLLPVFGTFAIALMRLLPPISDLGRLRMTIMESLPNCEIVYSLLHQNLNNIRDGEKELASFSSSIQFDHVSFAHKGRPGTLHDLSITFEKGKTTAIVGTSGAGKTTVVDLLLRLFDPDTGEVRVDGVNLREYKLSSWLRKIGFVSQDTFTFHDTVKNNITFGVNGYSGEEIIQAARNANAHDFIMEFPHGYDTVVGDRGMKLSGGQKQRIAIARAIVKNPEVLVLDEATSSLDNVSESLVQEAINKISAERTTIIIAHRLSTIINADKIVVLEDGRVMEEGTHRELLEKRGIYWSLYRVQENR